ncbi:hypothetical protein [Bradyrhizobium valentinum]|nr:hypothetical protein [Bradyrhizobium valentinum]
MMTLVRLAELRVRRQLQDGRALTLFEPRHKDAPAIGKLECVMMHVRLAGVESSKPGKSFALHTKPEARQEGSEGMDGLDFVFKSEFGAREKADCHARLAHRREASRFGPGKSGRD